MLNGPASEQSVAMIAAIAPNAPTNLAKLSSTRSTIEVQWAQVTDDGGTPVTGYKVYGNSGGSDTNFSEIAEVDAQTFSYERTGLTPEGETFKFKVAAFNAIETGTLTDELAIIAAGVPAQPNAPTKTSTSLSSISIEWVAPDDGGSDLTHYVLKMNEGTGSSTFDVIDDDIAPGDTTYTKSGLTEGQDYRFILIAVNAVGDSLDSPESADITVAVKPDAPGDPFYLASTQTSMQFGWTSPVDAGRSNGGTNLLGYII